MNKAQRDFVTLSSRLFKIINSHDCRLTISQFAKLKFLLKSIVEDQVIASDEWLSFPPLPYKSIDDISYYIDEISTLLKQNYSEIKLPKSEKVRLNKLIQRSATIVCSIEEDKERLNLLYLKENARNKSEQLSYREHLEVQIDQLQEKIYGYNKEIDLLLKCKELFQLWNKETPTKHDLVRIRTLEADNEVLAKMKKKSP